MPLQEEDLTMRRVLGEDTTTPEIVDEVIKRRFACRRFSPQPVPRETVEEVLAVARYAPSAANTQPGHVYVLSGEPKEDVSRALLIAHEEARDQHTSEYTYYANPMPDHYNARRQEFGRIFYGGLGIAQTDMVARADATARNYGFFGAPIGLIITIDRRLETGSWIDFGIFLQNIMIAACARGVDTCAQETFSKYHVILRDMLSIPPEEIVVCGMSLGFADKSWLEARDRMPKSPISDFTKFIGF